MMEKLMNNELEGYKKKRSWPILSSIHPMALQQNRTLASSIFCLHNVLSLAASFQLRQRKNLAASCCITSSRLFLGFPTDLTPSNLALSTLFGIHVLYILWACPTH
jgi:hypothetical protein